MTFALYRKVVVKKIPKLKMIILNFQLSEFLYNSIVDKANKSGRYQTRKKKEHSFDFWIRLYSLELGFCQQKRIKTFRTD